jgi:ketosteroid isomerase-like protein
VAERHHDPIRDFIRAINEGDLDGFEALLHPDVEIHAGRGLRRGREAARLWATKSPGGVQQTVELDQLWEEPERAVAFVTRRWHWAEDGEPAGADELAWIFELRDGLVISWRSDEDRQAALKRGGFHPGRGD